MTFKYFSETAGEYMKTAAKHDTFASAPYSISLVSAALVGIYYWLSGSANVWTLLRPSRKQLVDFL
jgi:hypothetical protein